MSLFPRFISHDFVANDIAPVWRLLDNYANQMVSARNQHASLESRSFNPRFDVKEVESAYELKGELPGVEQSNVEIEFPDQRTIVIKGSTEHSREAGPSSVQQTAQAIDDVPQSETSSHKATVEDEPEYVDASHEASAESTTTTASGQVTPSTTVATQQQVEQQPEASAPSSRYWVSERSSGQFQRVFTFPSPVDTEHTTAKLRNGVLEVVIPKVPKAGVRKISIE